MTKKSEAVGPGPGGRGAGEPDAAAAIGRGGGSDINGLIEKSGETITITVGEGGGAGNIEVGNGIGEFHDRTYVGVATDEQIERDNGLFKPAGQSDGDTVIVYETEMPPAREGIISVGLVDGGLGYITPEPNHAEKTAALIARIEAHEAEQVEIEKVTRELGHDVKSIRTIRRARDKAEKAKRTLDALYGAGLVKEGQV